MVIKQSGSLAWPKCAIRVTQKGLWAVYVQPTRRSISHRNEWSFLVYMIPFRDFAPERNFRSGAATGVNSRRCESPQHELESFWWYHVNKYRTKRGNRSELASVRKSPRYHVNSPKENLPFFSVNNSAFCNVLSPNNSLTNEIVFAQKLQLNRVQKFYLVRP